MSLAITPLAKTVRVRRVRSQGPLSYRLMELGLVEGAQVQVVGRAPLGDPLRVRLGDYELSLRAGEAELVDVA
ncbi:MAG: FeoA domain-containing protein [Phycisphaerae bacterium]